jgi:hypothetical protein
LQLRNVVAAQFGFVGVQKALSKSPSRFDQALPRGLVDDAGDGESPCALKRFDDRDRALAKLFAGVTRRPVTERGETFV